MDTIELPLDGTRRDKLRPVSKLLFRSEYALEAFVLIAQSDRFYNGKLAEITGCQPNFASSIIGRLKEANMIEPMVQEEGQSRQYFQKTASPLWSLLLEMANAALNEPQAEVTHLRPHG